MNRIEIANKISESVAQHVATLNAKIAELQSEQKELLRIHTELGAVSENSVETIAVYRLYLQNCNEEYQIQADLNSIKYTHESITTHYVTTEDLVKSVKESF